MGQYCEPRYCNDLVVFASFCQRGPWALHSNFKLFLFCKFERLKKTSKKDQKSHLRYYKAKVKTRFLRKCCILFSIGIHSLEVRRQEFIPKILKAVLRPDQEKKIDQIPAKDGKLISITYFPEN